MELGRNIRKIRELKNFTQEYIAGELGVSRKWYSMIENDQTEIKDGLLEKIAKTLAVETNDIINFDAKQVLNSSFKDNAINNGTVFLIQKENFEQQKALYQQLLLEKDLRIKQLEEMVQLTRKKK